ncbi:MAG: glycoside hydrolase family 3 N-terminal domain-containing protein [Solirubrobacteraceae bacterium]
MLTVAIAACGETRIHLVDATQTARASNAGGTPASEAPTKTSGERQAPSLADAPSAAPTTIAKAVGQMLMSHVTGLTASHTLLARVRSGQIGSVILYRENISTDAQLSHLTSSLQQAAKAGNNPPLFIGTDQEGGSVKRLHNSPPTMSAREMGASQHPRSTAEAQGLATAQHLRRLGINLDFAPVSDIPTTGNNFLGDRAFGPTPRSVVEGATGFAIGLARGGVAGSAKHFPGLGAAGPLDSDFSIVAISASKEQLRASYAPYESMARAGALVAPMVMISDASYVSLDRSGVPAVLSKQVLHGELTVAGMAGRVAITDDLEVPLVERYSEPAVKAVLAGDDILMFAQHESSSEQAYQQILAGLTTGAIPSSLVLSAALKVETLKQRLRLSPE